MEVTVLTASKSAGIGDGLTYKAQGTIKTGTIVSVPLRKSAVEGIVLGQSPEEGTQKFSIRSIKELLSEHPLLSTAHVQTLRWMAREYCCSLRQAARVFLPSPPWRTLLPQQQTVYRSVPAMRDVPVSGTKQQAVLEQLSNNGWVEEATLRTASGATRQTLNRLVELGFIECEQQIETIPEHTEPTIDPPKLTAEQQVQTDAIWNDQRPSLLFGITGSGKTEVYAELVARTVREGKQAILLVPEILLTEHCIHRFQALLGEEHIAVLHSRLTEGQRRAAWRNIHQGAVRLVIGSRSALFAPLANVGLVILDEEHEWTYKNEQTPRYHARETAQALCAFAGAKLVLGSATPSLESWSRAKKGSYHLARLPERYQGHALPTVRVVDLATVQFGKVYPFSPPLIEAIKERLTRGEQSILFLNHRGTATALLCIECRRRVVSPHSQLPFTVHRSAGGAMKLVDHTTNLILDPPTACPHCGSVQLRAVGAGTQRIEALVEQLFPTARSLRADSDTLTHPEHMRLLLKKMREGQADILLGTQSVVKGLDLPNVTLAAVLLADVGLSLPHFRAGERTFQLLTQLTGRSGRSKPGDVIIQTFRPAALEIRNAADHKTEEYLDTELALRQRTGYPPEAKMIRLITRGPNAKERATQLQHTLERSSEHHGSTACISSGPTFFGGGKEWHVLVRGSNPKQLLTGVDLHDTVIDVDPVECI